MILDSPYLFGLELRDLDLLSAVHPGRVAQTTYGRPTFRGFRNLGFHQAVYFGAWRNARRKVCGLALPDAILRF